MAGDDAHELPLQKRFEYEALRRAIQQAEDIRTLRTQALNVIDVMEAQQMTVMKMLRQGWLNG